MDFVVHLVASVIHLVISVATGKVLATKPSPINSGKLLDYETSLSPLPFGRSQCQLHLRRFAIADDEPAAGWAFARAVGPDASRHSNLHRAGKACRSRVRDRAQGQDRRLHVVRLSRPGKESADDTGHNLSGLFDVEGDHERGGDAAF